jgi:hypothetical protein
VVRALLLVFYFVYGIFHPGDFLLGLLGWREKRGFVSPPSQSLLVPRRE